MASLHAAYHQRYRESSRWKSALWTLSAALFATGVVLAAAGVESAALGLVASGYLLASRLVLRPEMTRAHREAVVIQEQYDVTVFGMGWNEALVGRRRPLVEIEGLAARHDGDAVGAERWYVGTGRAPHGMSVMLLQLENVSWGRLDHHRFAVLSGAGAAASLAAITVGGLLTHASLAGFIATLVAPSLPWILDLLDLAVLHRKASQQRAGIEQDIITLWDAAVQESVDVSSETLRVMQDRIYLARRASGRVPGWFYQLFRDRNLRAFTAAASTMLGACGWSDDA
jgi:hypothetical protein